MSLKIQASSHFVAESHIESADAIPVWKIYRPHASHQAELMHHFWEAGRHLNSITFLPDNNHLLEENNNCRYVAMVSHSLQCQLVFRMRKILIVDVDLGIK